MFIIISQITEITISPEITISLPQVISVPTTLRATQNMVGDQRPPFPLSFTLPLNGREHPYGMPTALMASMNPSASTHADNATANASPVNLYSTSGSNIRNLGRIVQPPGGLAYIPQGMPSLTSHSLQSVSVS